MEFPVAKTPLEDHPGHWKFTFKLITNDLCLQCFDTVGWAAGLGHPACKNGGWWRWALVSSDGVAPSQMVGVSDSVYLPCTIESRSSLLAPAHPGGPGIRAVKRLWCGGG